MDKFNSLKIKDILDANMLRVARAVTRLWFTWSDYSCGGHFDTAWSCAEWLYRVTNANKVFIAININHADERAVLFIENIHIFAETYWAELYTLASGLSLSYTILPDEQRNTYLKKSDIRRISKKTGAYLHALASLLEGFLSAGERTKQITHQYQNMTAFIVRGSHVV